MPKPGSRDAFHERPGGAKTCGSVVAFRARLVIGTKGIFWGSESGVRSLGFGAHGRTRARGACGAVARLIPRDGNAIHSAVLHHSAPPNQREDARGRVPA